MAKSSLVASNFSIIDKSLSTPEEDLFASGLPDTVDGSSPLDDKKLAKKIKLTDKELKLFEDFEWAVLCDNGLRQLNGGYSKVTIYDTDEGDDNEKLLICEVECGEQNMGDGHSNCDKWLVAFNRKTQKFEEK